MVQHSSTHNPIIPAPLKTEFTSFFNIVYNGFADSGDVGQLVAGQPTLPTVKQD